jgi:hypothetical protein
MRAVAVISRVSLSEDGVAAVTLTDGETRATLYLPDAPPGFAACEGTDVYGGRDGYLYVAGVRWAAIEGRRGLRLVPRAP